MSRPLTVGELSYIVSTLKTFDSVVDPTVFTLDANVVDPNGDVAGVITYDGDLGHIFLPEE